LAGSGTVEGLLRQLDWIVYDPATIGVGTFSENNVNALAGSPPDTGIPSGTEITVNTRGGFFQSGPSTSVGYGIPSWMTGGSLGAQMEIVIHELAHDFQVPGFADDYHDPGAQTHNNELVMQHCGSVINRWADRSN
jgi:hypothetical protein